MSVNRSRAAAIDYLVIYRFLQAIHLSKHALINKHFELKNAFIVHFKCTVKHGMAKTKTHNFWGVVLNTNGVFNFPVILGIYK